MDYRFKQETYGLMTDIIGLKYCLKRCSPRSNNQLITLYIQVEVDTRHIGWINCPIPEEDCKYIQLSFRGPDHSLRVRQVKVLGDNVYLSVRKSAAHIQQVNCEGETLKVFRLLTSQVWLVSLHI